MIRRISLLSKKEDDEEEDPFGWEQRTRGIGVLPDIVEEEAVEEVEVEKPSKIVRIKPISVSTTAMPAMGADIGGATDDASLHLIRNPYLVQINQLTPELEKDFATLDNYDNTLTKLDEQFEKNPTQELADQFNSILGKRQSLFKEYESKGAKLDSAISEYNKQVDTKNIQADVRYKHAFKQYKQLTGLPGEAGKATPLPKDEPIEPKSFFEGLPETGKKVVQMLGGMQGFKLTEPETYKQIDDISKVINEQPDKLSKIAKAHELLTGESIEQSLEEMGKPTLQPWDKSGFTYQPGVGETEFTKLPEKFNQAQALVQQAMQFSTSGKIGDVMRTVAQDVVLGYLATTGLKALYRSGMKVEGKWISGKKLEAAMGRAQKAYISETNKFKASLSNNDFEIVKAVTKIVRTTGVKAGEIAGVKVPQRVLFGQPTGSVINVVKIIQNAGKITQEVSTQLSMMPMTDKLQVMQELSKIDPTLVASMATEFAGILAKPEVKAVEKPEAIPEPTKVTTPVEPREVLKAGVKAPWKMTKKEYIGDTIWIESAKNEHIQSVVKALGEGKPVPAEVLADYPDLKAEVKPTTITTAPVVEPAAVKKEAVVEPTPKVAPAIPAELEGLAEDITVYRASAKPFNKDVMDEDGIFVTPDKTFAERWQKSQKYGNLEELTISANAKILKREDIPKEFTEVKNGNNIISDQDAVIKYAKENGYDGYEEYGIDSKGNIIDREIAIWNKDKITLTAPVAEKATVAPAKAEVKAEIVPEVELATPIQIKKAHAIADTKALISEKGKVKPQYRKIAEVFTGKKSIKDMTPEEAEMFIDMLDRLPKPKYKAGKLVAPSIPRTMKLTTEGFFQKQYGEPTPIWLLTDQTYYATKLGIKPLVEPFEKGKQEFDLEFRRSSNLADRMVNKLNQVAKTSMGDRIKSKVKNIPTKAESNMAGLLNKHEATPPGLSQNEEDIFKYFRNLSKDIWRRENEVREKVDLPPIKYKQAYFRHTADAMAKEMLEGKYPFPQGIKYWSEKMVGKKIFNPMEFHRKLSDDLIDIWSKDIRAVTKAMLWNGLKEIYLAEPAKFLNEQLNAISKDLPEYKNLTPREQAAYDQTRVMPASTKKWLTNYINQVIKGQENEFDASLNRIVTKSGLKGIFDKVLSPFGRSIGRKPITNIASLSGRMVISGVMGWVPRQIIRNAFQQVQNLALYGVQATLKAFLPNSIDKNLKGLLSESLFMKSYTGFEELPVDLMGKLEKAWLTPYGIVAVNNAKQGMKAAYWNILELIKNPKFKKHGWADPQRTKDTPKGFLYPSEKEKLLKEMEFGASATQYQYIPMGMPGVFRYKALIPLTRLQSWWMNYFTKFNREAIHRGLKGRPSWSDEDGPTLPWSRRVNYLKYLVIGGAILTALGYKKSFMLGVAPTYLSPAAQVALGFYNYATATKDWQKKRAKNQIFYAWKAFIPGSLAWRDFMAVWNGEKDLEEILFYGKTKEKKKVAPTVIGKPSIPKISIPKISIGKIKRISPVKSKF